MNESFNPKKPRDARCYLEKKWRGYQTVKKFDDMFSILIQSMTVTDWQTDGQRDNGYSMYFYHDFITRY